jgi:hypothetical membrane protein
LIVAGAAAPVIHIATVAFLAAFSPGYSHTRHAVSRLGTASNELASLMNMFGFGATGLLVCVFALAFVAVLGAEPSALIAAGAWLGSGLSFVALGVWPHPGFHHLEFLAYCSGLAILGMLSGAVAMSAAIRSYWLWPVTVLAVLTILAYVWLAGYRRGLGLVQRVHLGGVVLWLEAAALHLWKIDDNAV